MHVAKYRCFKRKSVFLILVTCDAALDPPGDVAEGQGSGTKRVLLSRSAALSQMAMEMDDSKEAETGQAHIGYVCRPRFLLCRLFLPFSSLFEILACGWRHTQNVRCNQPQKP